MFYNLVGIDTIYNNTYIISISLRTLSEVLVNATTYFKPTTMYFSTFIVCNRFLV